MSLKVLPMRIMLWLSFCHVKYILPDNCFRSTVEIPTFVCKGRTHDVPCGKPIVRQTSSDRGSIEAEQHKSKVAMFFHDYSLPFVYCACDESSFVIRCGV